MSEACEMEVGSVVVFERWTGINTKAALKAGYLKAGGGGAEKTAPNCRDGLSFSVAVFWTAA